LVDDRVLDGGGGLSSSKCRTNSKAPLMGEAEKGPHSSTRRGSLRGRSVARAEAALEATTDVIAYGFLRLDREEWVRAVARRRSALGR
jgi:hypothetical protein